MTPETRGRHLRFEVLPKPPLPSASGEGLPFANLATSKVNRALDPRVRRPALVALPSSDEESSHSDPYEDLSSLGIIHSQFLAPRKQGARSSRARKSAVAKKSSDSAPPQQESNTSRSPSAHSASSGSGKANKSSSSSGKTSYYSAGPMYFQHHRQKSPSPTPSEQEAVERFEGVASFMHKPSSPPVYSSTTSNSLTDEGGPKSVWKHDRAWRAEQRRLGNMQGSDVRGGAEAKSLPPGYRRDDQRQPSEATDERLDEFMRSSSKLCEKLYTRMEALEGVVEVLLEGYKKISRRVGGLEKTSVRNSTQSGSEKAKQKAEMEELGERLGFLNKAMREGRMPKLEHVYHEKDPTRRGSGGKAAGKRPVRR